MCVCLYAHLISTLFPENLTFCCISHVFCLISTLFPPYFDLISTLCPPYVHLISTIFPPYFYLISTLFLPYFYLISEGLGGGRSRGGRFWGGGCLESMKLQCFLREPAYVKQGHRVPNFTIHHFFWTFKSLLNTITFLGVDTVEVISLYFIAQFHHVECCLYQQKNISTNIWPYHEFLINTIPFWRCCVLPLLKPY